MRTPIFVLALVSSATAAVETKLTPQQIEFFETKVRPILSESCYKCHSIEQGKSKGGLTLDTRPGWEKGGEGGKVIEPGMPDASPLIRAIRYKDPDLQMPPKGEKLSDTQIATLVQWVKMGAPDPRDGDKNTAAKLSGLTESARKHWAYQPVKSPAVPQTKNPGWSKTPIDSFILAKLEENGMQPNKAARKETLLRRAYYDLIGLPPSPYEVHYFLKDESPRAFDKVLDHLLSLPQYGERWGRHWLDTARYSDTIGGDKNANRTTEYRYPNAWTYRDYVIKSFNEDKPYDAFVKEQLAADLLPGVTSTDPRLAALGFLTVGERFQNPNDIINDRIDAMGKGFMGLTVSCSRCHDHKFDPIPTKDYYALHGVFASVFEPEDKPLISAAANPNAIKDYEQKFNAGMQELRNRYFETVGAYLADFWAKPEAYLKAAVATAGKRGEDVEGQKERNAIIKDNGLDDQFLNFLSRALQRVPSVWGPLYSIKREGRFDVAWLEREDQSTGRKLKRLEEGPKGKFAGSSDMMMMTQMIREDAARGPNKYVAEALKKTPPKDLAEAIKVYANLLRSTQPQAANFIARMRTAESANDSLDQDLVDLLRGPFTVEPAPMMSKEIIQANYLTWQPRMQGRSRLNFGELNLLETSHPGAPAKAMVVNDKPNPRNSPVFIRGEAQSVGPIVPRGFLGILSPDGKPVTFREGSGRLELAEAVASKDNPLTARVAVNRVWMYHFGDGLVSTPDDLGVQCGQPTHPELLDYLTSQFVESGWSLKKLHKLIMSSAVYQQSCETTAAYETKDPDNHLLWRANIRRLDFEAMRDSLLVFSGELDKTVGGKPVNLTDEPYSYRRSVYGYIDRGNLPELMQNFDFSDPDMPNSKRASTIVPQQALFLMNSSMAVDISRKLIGRPEIQRAIGADEKVRWIYRIVFQRLPSDSELSFARNFLSRSQSGLVAANAVSRTVPPKRSGRGSSSKTPAVTNVTATRRQDPGKFGAIQNEGDVVNQRQQLPWEAYAQALLFTNELAYVN